MEVTRLIAERFVKYVTEDDLFSDEMRVPHRFCEKHGHRIPQTLFLEFRNGYRVQITFSYDLGTFLGIQCLYDDFDLEGGELFLFQYNGVDGFNVYLIGRDFCEIDYPAIVHRSQNCRPHKVSLQKGGLHGIRFLTEGNPVHDEFVPPRSFIDRCVNDLSLRCFVDYILSNGKKVSGGFNHSTGALCGFHLVGQHLGIPDLNRYNMLLLNYAGNVNLTVGVFDDDFVEVLSQGTPLSIVESMPVPSVETNFTITVQPCHSQQYCPGVNISAEYRPLLNMWSRTDYISVYSGTAC
ncbi:hypothetical protein DCAR_0728112 [Daucus carota subsp. sativus]|uniref:Uncharacterized protein n=1 Tax=Daucus carota subsp. sativus TaxID=79200 RepID=A0A164T895_DAUCS|nr:hypothetical protein DCAR_0728112 [Daucus carota subsp. sativus]